MKKILLCIISVVCVLSAEAGQTRGEIVGYIAHERDITARSKDADRAVELLEYIDQQDIGNGFNICGGPFDKNHQLLSAVWSCSGFLSENTLDSRWGRLAKISINDIESIARMLESENVGERALALFKLQGSDYQGGLEGQLLSIQQNDPLVYFGITRQGMRGPREPPHTEPVLGKFVAHLRSMARDVLKKQGFEVVPEEEFRKRYEEFGVERLIGFFVEDDSYLRNGVLNMFQKMDLDSYGGKYLNLMEHHDKIPDGYLYVLKQHLNKRMDISRGLVLQKDLDRALEGWDGNVPVTVSSPESVAERAEEMVPEKEDTSLLQEKPVQETDIVVAQTNSTPVDPILEATEEKSSNPWKVIVPIIGVLLVAIFALFRFRKR